MNFLKKSYNIFINEKKRKMCVIRSEKKKVEEENLKGWKKYKRNLNIKIERSREHMDGEKGNIKMCMWKIVFINILNAYIYIFYKIPSI